MAKGWSAKGKARYHEGTDINMEGKCYSMVDVRRRQYSGIHAYIADNKMNSKVLQDNGVA